MTDYQDQFLEYVKTQLMGPPISESQTWPYQKNYGPEKNYIMGRLFPQGSVRREDNPEEQDRLASEESDPLALSFEIFPSSVGISFLVEEGTELNIEVGGALYLLSEKSGEEEEDKWERQSYQEIITINSTPGSERFSVLNNNAELYVKSRSSSAGILITATLINSHVTVKRGSFKTEEVIFRTTLVCSSLSGKILPYPNPFRKGSDDEEEEISILYRDRFAFAVGHGSSASWVNRHHECESVSIDFMPTANLKGVIKNPEEMKDMKVLSLQFLADKTITKESLLTELMRFVDVYEDWITLTTNKLKEIDINGAELAKERIENKLKVVLQRMRDGVSFICSNDNVLESFRLANLSMQMQMIHSREDFTYPLAEKDYLEDQRWDNRWFPFQLAFFLLTVESTSLEEHKDRETVEVLWFPTGGGKTEAYLLLAAFEIIRKWSESETIGLGTTVIMRYTLQLLTADQFLRAAKLICALELIRRQNSNMATTPITIGLWAGEKVSPNKFIKAREKYQTMLDEDIPETRFQIDTCPWCQTKLLPDTRSRPSDYGFKATNTSFKIFCLNKDCDFHEELPVNVVDDHLYRYPPAFLVSTVDKFARACWIEGPGKFLGSGEAVPPSLIIQDELHLISGPLGTICGVYESAFDVAITNNGGKPKIIAATATIRGAANQAKGLYGREVLLFPPSGCDADDSFFTKTDYKDPGRLYIGMMPLGTMAVTTIVHTLAALLQGTHEISGTPDEEDSYSTLVSYNITRRELGKSLTLIRDDIPDRIRSIYEDTQRIINTDKIKELSSNVGREEARKTRQRMDIKKGKDGHLDAVMCTNMISVGVDIPRLGIMHINGQPKTTSEFIQASSRVGRGKVPGMVFVNYKGTKPRDRSHFEQFQSYLNSIYRFVEPTSVTPTAHPARRRGIHAAFIILMRHVADYMENSDAANFRKDGEQVQSLKLQLIKRILLSGKVEEADVEKDLNEFINKWHERAETHRNLKFEASGNQYKSLMYHFGEQEVKGAWPTLNSMRNIDAESEIKRDGFDYV